jgi:aldehyde dehydrogenase family 7 protein A1
MSIRKQFIRFYTSGKVDIPSIMKALDLSTESVIPGVYNGKWGGSGSIVESINPATHQVLGRVQVGTPGDLNETLEVMSKAKKIWSEVPI